MLLTHGARSVLRAATRGRAAPARPSIGLRSWALAVQARTNHNKATCALANKLARICYATLRDGAALRRTATRPNKKIDAHRASRLPPEDTSSDKPHPEPCVEIDRPSWQTGSPPHRLTPITLPAASRLPLATIGAAVSADSMSARATQSPLQMPDIRLQAHPRCQHLSISLFLLGGSPYTRG